MHINGKTALITGGASGIGLAMAEAFAARGAKIAIADIEQQTLAHASERLRGSGAQVFSVELDVSAREAMENAAQDVEKRFGSVDILCNNAGVLIRRPLDEVTYEDWEWVFNVNVQGVINGLMTFLPRFKARRHGHIVNTASTAGLFGQTQMGIYAASKFAVVGLSESLRADMASHDIGVSVLCPGAVDTSILTSHRNRPSAAACDSGLGGAESVRTFMPDEVIAASDVGEKVANAIEANEFYILTHPNCRAALVERHERLLAACGR